MRQYFDHKGQSISIGREIGRGGEGAVFELRGQSACVAKLYHNAVPEPKRVKLAAMVQRVSRDILNFAAWPVSTIHNSRGGEVVGVVLPRIDSGKEIHFLYSPAQRRVLYPTATWAFLIHVARNCAAAFDVLHSSKIVIGDVNQGNLFVTPQALVRLIDCDSFQLESEGRLYRCEVGVPHFTPPELQNARFDQITRTTNHDCFGLALLIFHLLFMGRHPFAGRFLGAGDMPIERAISEHRFAYSRNGITLQMQPPPQSISLSGVPADIANMFEQAFGQQSDAAQPRPTAQMWVAALDRLEKSLRPCQLPGHLYAGHLPHCPWCEVERSGGPNFFISATIHAYSGSLPRVDVAAIWREIEAIDSPGVVYTRAPRIPLSQIQPRRIADQLDDAVFMRRWVGRVAMGSIPMTFLGFFAQFFAIAGALLFVVFAVWWALLYWFRPERRIRSQLTRMCAEAESELRDAHVRFNARKQSNATAFFAKRDDFAMLRSTIETLDAEKGVKIDLLRDSVKEKQLEAYLRSFLLEDAKISGIGPARLATLVSHGVETAADISSESVRVPGIADVLAAELMSWRRSIEVRFRFDSSKGLPTGMQRNVEIQFLQRRFSLERQLQGGPQKLREMARAGRTELELLDQGLAMLENTLQQIKADLEVWYA